MKIKGKKNWIRKIESNDYQSVRHRTKDLKSSSRCLLSIIYTLFGGDFISTHTNFTVNKATMKNNLIRFCLFLVAGTPYPGKHQRKCGFICKSGFICKLQAVRFICPFGPSALCF